MSTGRKGAPFKDKRFVKVRVGIRMQKWIVDYLRSNDTSMIDQMETALIEYYKLEKPV